MRRARDLTDMPGASPSLDIPPHSRRLSGFAVAAVVLLGAAAFASGLAHQLQPRGPSPFPAAQPRAPNDQTVAQAEPAPALQAAAPPRARKTSTDDGAPAAAPDASGASQDAASRAEVPAADTATPANADDTAPQAAPAQPQPADLDPPT